MKWLEFELRYYDVVVQHIRHYVTDNFPHLLEGGGRQECQDKNVNDYTQVSTTQWSHLQ